VSFGGRARTVRRGTLPTIGLLVILGALLLSTVPAASPGAAMPTPGASPGPAAVGRSASPAAVPRPAGGVTNATIGPIFNSTMIYPPALGDRPCYWDNGSYADYGYCEAQTQSPTIVTLQNGVLGLGFSELTTLGPLCNATGGTNFSSWTVTSIGWERSTTNGTTWGPDHVIGGVNCEYPASSEPTFASGRAGAVYGAFVASNQTENTTVTAYGGEQQASYPMDWNDSANATLAFLASRNNGINWSTPSLVPGVLGVARPQMAVFGGTVYVTYIHIPQNLSTTVYPIGQYLGYSPALSVQLVYTTDNGSTWNGPYTLPGQNASMGNWSSSPSIAVNAAGKVAVAFATDRSCVESCLYPPYATYADNIVVATSSTNGSSWAPPVTAATGVGESNFYPSYYDYYVYEVTYAWQLPVETSIAFAVNGSSIFLAYSGSYYSSPVQTYYNWEYGGVFAASSFNGGATWTNSTVQLGDVQEYDSVYAPAIAVSGTTEYIAYVWMNDSYCNGANCNPYVGGYSAWLATGTNGSGWESLPTGVSPMPYPYDIESAYQGFTSSVTFDRAGHPVTATTLPGEEVFRSAGKNGTSYIYRTTDEANVTVGYEVSSNSTYLRFVEHNLTAGATWGVTVDGYVVTSNRSTINVTNAPLHVGLLLGVLPQPSGYRTIEESTPTLPSYVFLNHSATDFVLFQKEYGIVLALEPKVTRGLDVYARFQTQYFSIDEGPGYVDVNPPFPWYFPVGATVTFQSNGIPPVTYWNGTGAGSYTGGGSGANLTVSFPLNETAWGGTFGVYTEQFSALGLPSTSTYSFQFAGLAHQGAAGNITYVANVSTGGYTVSDIQANSTTPGWEYFGWVVGSGGTDLIVVPAQPTVSLSFAYVDVAASVTNVTFQANGIGAGTVWSVEFNGTTYSSSVPTLNVSTKPGVFPWAVDPAVASNGSVGYAPVRTASSVTVTAGATVLINYTSAYRVDVVAGLGGSVSSVGNHWVASGTEANYTAVAATNYAFGGWTGAGAGSYTGPGVNGTASVTADGAITETASFYPLPDARFNMTFLESGVPAGVWWTVYLNGVGYSSNATTLEVGDLLSCAAGPSGQYRVAVPDAYDTASEATRFEAQSGVPTNPVCTNGALDEALTFAPQFEVSVAATEGGTAYAADALGVSNESVWAGPNDTVILTAAPDIGTTFGGWNGTGVGSYTGGSLSTPVLGLLNPVSEFATFVPVAPPPTPTFRATFESSVKFPSGTSWSVTIGNHSYAAFGPTVTVSGLPPGTYTASISGAISADGLTKWAPVESKIPIRVSGNLSVPANFGKASYWLEITTSAGGSATPSSSWAVAGSSLTLNASANLGDQFVNWSGTGDGSYNGTSSTTTVTVFGPITETATFVPVAAATTVSSTVWQSPTTWAVLGGVGLLVGLIVGIAVRRSRGGPPASDPPMGNAPEPWAGPVTAPETPSEGGP
jgi:hypothetical protein